ncbi:hypothetical protein CL619_03970 [archaeon]|nr:hypothetical protein [archaeon]
MKIDLIQPRHNYAPSIESGEQGHVYLPTALLTVAARLLEAGIYVGVHDENLKEAKVNSKNVGISLLGAPYIPEAISLQERLEQEAKGRNYFLGGQVISGLSDSQLTKLFGDRGFNGNNNLVLSKQLGIDILSLPSVEETSLVPAYELLDNESMQEYLSREFSLSVSQGCKFACSFCAAPRSHKDPVTGIVEKNVEKYRNLEVVGQELDYLSKRAAEFGLDKLDMYMSNLDIFQTPAELIKFANVVQQIRKNNPRVALNLRALSTVDSYLRAREHRPDAVEAIVEAGFHTVGFGVDGWTKDVWNAVKKGHNTEEKCLEAIRSAKEDYNITPEILMVFGHPCADDEYSLEQAHEVTERVVEKYGAIPRPHVAKEVIPGNDGWVDPNKQHIVEALMNDYGSFQGLDFAATPSAMTHENPITRILATKYFLKMCDLPGNTTQPVLAITPGMSDNEVRRVQEYNLGKYDR